jgi:surfactin synthase thioesterase subunit
VYAVELPGHHVAAEREPFAPNVRVVEQVVAQVVTELDQRGLTRVMLWGHSSGTALAVATARELHERGIEVARLFLAAQLPRDAVGRRAEADQLAGRTYAELSKLDAQRAEHIGAAYRHDCVAVHRYFAELLDAPVAQLPVPVTAVVAADDPSTPEFPHRHADWRLLAEHVDAVELTDGGHYFLPIRPGEAAAEVLRAAGILASR